MVFGLFNLFGKEIQFITRKKYKEIFRESKHMTT